MQRCHRNQRFFPNPFGVIALVAAVCLVNSYESTTARAADYPQYLVFQLFMAGAGFTDVPKGNVLTNPPAKTKIDQDVQAIIDVIGERGDENHVLGFAIGPLALDYTRNENGDNTENKLRSLIQDSFDIALAKNVAVVFHIDDSKFWHTRKDLWSDKKNIEWVDWDGTANTGQYLNWGSPWQLAPQVCFNSPTVVKEVKRIAGDIIGREIRFGMDRLRARNREYLFGGVIVGWETALGRDFVTQKTLGYCALTNRGFSKSNPPRDQAYKDEELEKVLKEWIETWSGAILAAGVPRDKIFSHIAFSPPAAYDARKAPSYSEHVLWTPPSVAFGNNHYPGFTTYPDEGILGQIYAELGRHGNPPWASAEGTNVWIHEGPPKKPAQSMETYLASLFNHGATITNLFGWGIGDHGNPFRDATEGPASIQAYRKFLRGESLVEQTASEGTDNKKQTLRDRIRALPSKIEAYVQGGGDMRKVGPKVKEMQGFLDRGDLVNVERVLNEILAIVE
ncbi:MAG: hypothetical protein U1F76_15440 [Candidatus Competibacteraceae bacterium]